jgi:hypothetical protein
VEGESFPLDPVLLPARGGDPGEPGRGRTVEEVGPVGLEPAETRVKEVDEVLAEPRPAPW